MSWKRRGAEALRRAADAVSAGARWVGERGFRAGAAVWRWAKQNAAKLWQRNARLWKRILHGPVLLDPFWVIVTYLVIILPLLGSRAFPDFLAFRVLSGDQSRTLQPVDDTELVLVGFATWALLLLICLYLKGRKGDSNAVLAALVQTVIVTVSHLVLAALLYMRSAAQADECSAMPTTFPEAFYYSVVTWTTLGYGDYQPCRDFQLFAANEAMLGYAVIGLMVALLIEILEFGKKTAG